jgi:methionyl-tRNA synthetase
MITGLLAIGFIGLFFILMSVRLIFLKDGKFKGTCASQRAEGGSCGYCGKEVNPGEACENSKAKSAIEKILSKF